MSARPQIIGLAGWSGSGKTTLLKALIPTLTGRGVRLSTIKHAHHRFDVDTPGKDSYEHRAAGATEVLVGSAQRWALMHELRGAGSRISSSPADLADERPRRRLLSRGRRRDHGG